MQKSLKFAIYISRRKMCRPKRERKRKSPGEEKQGKERKKKAGITNYKNKYYMT